MFCFKFEGSKFVVSFRGIFLPWFHNFAMSQTFTYPPSNSKFPQRLRLIVDMFKLTYTSSLERKQQAGIELTSLGVQNPQE